MASVCCDRCGRSAGYVGSDRHGSLYRCTECGGFTRRHN